MISNLDKAKALELQRRFLLRGFSVNEAELYYCFHRQRWAVVRWR